MHKNLTGPLVSATVLALVACRPVLTESSPPSGIDVMVAVLRKSAPPAGFTQVIDRAVLAQATGWAERDVRHFAELVQGQALVAEPETTPACQGPLATKCQVLRVSTYRMGRDSATVQVVVSPLRGCGSQSSTFAVQLRTRTGALQPELVASGSGDCGRR